MFENPRRGRQARNFTTNAPKILDLKSSSEQIFSRKFPLGAPETSLKKTIPRRKLKNTTISAFVGSCAFHWPYPGKRVNMLCILWVFFFQISPIILALRKCFIDRCTSEYCVSDTRDVTMVSVVWITTAILELINRLQRNWVPCMSPHSIAVR